MLGDFAHDFLQVIIVYGLIARTTRLLSFKYSYSVEGRAPYKGPAFGGPDLIALITVTQTQTLIPITRTVAYSGRTLVG
ncbi:hypothetical protein C0989_011203 [Termitomyces sp. Mn162]|nr:hypothetical protein C0989_011203 [Termitomyces sp. Mn162]